MSEATCHHLLPHRDPMGDLTVLIFNTDPEASGLSSLRLFLTNEN